MNLKHRTFYLDLAEKHKVGFRNSCHTKFIQQDANARRMPLKCDTGTLDGLNVSFATKYVMAHKTDLYATLPKYNKVILENLGRDTFTISIDIDDEIGKLLNDLFNFGYSPKISINGEYIESYHGTWQFTSISTVSLIIPNMDYILREIHQIGNTMYIVAPEEAYCCLAGFSCINGKPIDSIDFVEKSDEGGDETDECGDDTEDCSDIDLYGCKNMQAHPKEATTAILNKYNIDEDAYKVIAFEIAEALSFGRCGWCI